MTGLLRAGFPGRVRQRDYRFRQSLSGVREKPSGAYLNGLRSRQNHLSEGINETRARHRRFPNPKTSSPRHSRAGRTRSMAFGGTRPGSVLRRNHFPSRRAPVVRSTGCGRGCAPWAETGGGGAARPRSGTAGAGCFNRDAITAAFRREVKGGWVWVRFARRNCEGELPCIFPTKGFD